MHRLPYDSMPIIAYRFPQKNAKILSEKDNGQGESTAYLRFMQPNATLADSLLWDEQSRDRLLKPRYRKADLDKRRQAVSCNPMTGSSTTQLI